MYQRFLLHAGITLTMCSGCSQHTVSGRTQTKDSLENPSLGETGKHDIPSRIPVEEMYSFIHSLTASGTGMGGGHVFEGKGTGFFVTDYNAEPNPWFDGVHSVGVKLVTIDRGTIITDVAIGSHTYKIRDRNDTHFRLQDR